MTDKIKKSAAILFWIAVWHIASVIVNEKLLLVSPLQTVQALWGLVQTAGFYRAIATTIARIGGGFLCAFVASVVLSLGAARFAAVRMLLEPLMRTIRAVPVASFVILVLMWAGTDSLSVVIAFLMVLPVLYESLLTGITHRDRALDEMAQVYRVPVIRRFRLITLPQLAPYLRSGLKVSLGLCWKAGVAAEVIGQPKGAIGTELYMAKVFFATADLFAWTVCIVLVSAALEKLLLKLYDIAVARIGGRV